MRNIWIALLFPLLLCAQNIRGRVVDAVTRKPLESATVFIAQSTFKTLTDSDGNFELPAYDGAWQLVITYVGYEAVAVPSSSFENLSVVHLIQLSPILEQIREVSVMSAKDRAKYLAYVRTHLLGTSQNADDARIVNPEVIMMDARKTAFEAYSDEPLIIEIPALNYRIEFLLTHFLIDWKANLVKFNGFASYSDLDAQKIGLKKVQRRRMEAYLGSSLHFFRTLVTGTFQEEGFSVRGYRKIAEGLHSVAGDSIYEPFSIDNPKRMQFRRGQMAPQDIVMINDDATFISCGDNLQVIYKKAPEEPRYQQQRRRSLSAFQLSEIEIRSPEVQIFRDGSYNDMDALVFYGYMGWKKLADMVPNDFNPESP